MSKAGGDRTILLCYFVAEAALLAGTVSLQTCVPESVYTKMQYPAIILNFIVMLHFYIHGNVSHGTWKEKAIPLALLLTLCADLFLVGINNYYIIGILLFCAVQTVYALYLGVNKISLLARAVLFVFLAVFVAKTDFTLLASSYSMANLTVNVFSAWHNYVKEHTPEKLLLAIGILLFFGCDVSVGIRNAAGLSTTLYAVSFYLVWIFYIPSQVFINMSFIRGVKGNKNS
ncbi:MAG: lysoplasmalogenase family protein [Solobacterium sp.]|jgi:hypothetical protein|nr:lysoplasmalogenase family protein [Solobacterium sp.]MCH4227335.1 lysoplasmalogenase family protein [Solobacterium sp.]MCH4282668.1 lysoplasmalogenase family protein [Solobacterium sp.]